MPVCGCGVAGVCCGEISGLAPYCQREAVSGVGEREVEARQERAGAGAEGVTGECDTVGKRRGGVDCP